MIQIRNLTKRYGGHVVLDGFSADIPENAVTCIAAPSGAGKTTLLRILMRLEPVDGGTVTGLEGKRMSTVFQEDRLLMDRTAAENVRLVRKGVSDERIRGILTALGIPETFDKPVCELSGGMRRRAALARALCAEYDVLFLDEPFKGLDDEAKARAIAVTKRESEGRTVLFVTHDLSEVDKMNAEIIRL